MVPPREGEIRNALVTRLRELVKPPARVINEFTIMRGENRVDVAVIGDHLHGFEIKSDVDTLKRLPDQAKHFGWCFHKMTLVVGQTHLTAAAALVPAWWGIILVRRDGNGVVKLRRLRPDGDNPKLNYRWVARLLWREEIVAILRRLNKFKGVTKLAHAKLAEHLRSVTTEDELVALVTSTILERKEWLRERGA